MGRNGQRVELTCIFPRDGYDCRSYEHTIMLQCCRITADGGSKPKNEAPPMALALPLAPVNIAPPPAYDSGSRLVWLLVCFFSDVSIFAESNSNLV